MTHDERERFDELFDQSLEELPAGLHELIEEVPVIVEDEPTGAVLRELAREPAPEHAGLSLEETEAALREELCGLHSGPMLTERSVESPDVFPEDIRIYRRGIINAAGGWEQAQAAEAVAQEIMITLLHEIGHHFGLDEDELAARGFA